MKRKLISGICFFLTISCALAQGENNFWYFGEYAGIDFNSGTPVLLTNGGTNTTEGTATVSDASGNLLFYTDGSTAWNSSHVVMAGGTNLGGDASSVQSALIVNNPFFADKYYVFTVGDGGSGSMQYAEIDMSMNGGLGQVIASNVFMYANVLEGLAATLHSNGTDFWIVGANSSDYLAFLVDCNGVSSTPVASGPGYAGSNYWQPMTFSPDGSKLASGKKQRARVMNFNTSTGITNGQVQYDTGGSNNDGIYGIQFSPNSQLLYVSCFGSDLVAQFNLATTAMTTLNPGTGGMNSYESIYTGPDGKLYIANNQNFGSKYLHVISNPNVSGAGCSFTVNALTIPAGSSESRKGLQNLLIVPMSSPCGPLPIEVSSFTGVCNQDKFILNWTTLSSSNSDYYRVERSIDGLNFEYLGEVEGLENSNTAFDFSFEGIQDDRDIGYYRLSHFDIDGELSFQKVITIDCERAGDQSVVYFSNELLVVETLEEAQIIVYDAKGSLVLNEHVNSGSHHLGTSENFETGMYLVKIIRKSEIENVRILK